ncbi:hypothetical protein VTO73DRAFT_13964 [Trametes versicolor]
MVIFHLFTLARGLARLGFEHINCVHLVLSSESTEGPSTGLTMMLPTCDPDYLDPDFFDPDFFDDWLETIQGPIITAAADDDDDDRAFLLRVVLTYRAFAQRNPAVNMDDYVVFTGMFVQAALALQVDDDAATDLQAIDEWMTETIPLEILEPRDLPPPGSTAAATAGTSAGAGSTAAATGTPVAAAVAAEATTEADNDEGFESDTYSDMPSLKTASDGSGGGNISDFESASALGPSPGAGAYPEPGNRDPDVVGLNERALTREELAENERLREMGKAADDRSVPLPGVVNLGEGHRTLSWIWYSAGVQATLQGDANDPGLRNALRVEWAKARARAARWHEQVRLVEEEMRRTIESTRHAARAWNLVRSRRQTHDNSALFDEALDEGLVAYSDRHCAMETALADAFEAKWSSIRAKAVSFINGERRPNGELVATSRTEEAAQVVELELDVGDADDVDEGEGREF